MTAGGGGMKTGVVDVGGGLRGIYAAGIRKRYPLAAEKLCKRAVRYNESVELAKQYEKEGKLLILVPDDTCGMDTLTRDMEAMKRVYGKGISNAEQIKDFLGK